MPTFRGKNAVYRFIEKIFEEVEYSEKIIKKKKKKIEKVLMFKK